MVHPLKASDWESAIRLATQVYETGLWASSGRTSSKVSDATVLASRMCTLQNRLTVAVDVPMAPKEWKKVFEDKVPQRLAQACCKVLAAVMGSSSGGNNSSSNSSSNSGQTIGVPSTAQVIPCGAYAAGLLYGFCVKAHMDGVVGCDSLARLGAHTAAYRQQLQRSGLFDLMPRLLLFAAKQLQAALPQATPSGSSSGEGGGRSDSTDSACCSNSGGTAGATTADEHMNSVEKLMLASLEIYNITNYSWPCGDFPSTIVPECAAPVLKAALVAFRYVNARLPAAAAAGQAHGPAASLAGGTEQLLELWGRAEVAVRVVTAPISTPAGAGCVAQDAAPLEPALQAYRASLLMCPELLPCTVLSLANIQLAMLLLQLPQLPGCKAVAAGSDGSSSSSSGAGSSNRSSVRSSSSSGNRRSGVSRLAPCESATAAWELAGREHAQLPATVQQLLLQLGCSSRTVVAAAAVMAASRAKQSSNGVAAASRLVPLVDARLCVHYCVTERQADAQLQRHSQVFVLLPSLLLYWAAHQPAERGADGKMVPADCAHAVQAASNSLSVAKRVCSGSPGARSLFKRVLDDVALLAACMGRDVLRALGSSSSSSAVSGAAAAGGAAAGAAAAANANIYFAPYCLLQVVCSLAEGAGSLQNSSSSGGCQNLSAWGLGDAEVLAELMEAAARSAQQLPVQAVCQNFPSLVEKVAGVQRGPVFAVALSASAKLCGTPNGHLGSDSHVRSSSGSSGSSRAAAAAAGTHHSGSSSAGSSSDNPAADYMPSEVVQYLSMYVSVMKLCEVMSSNTGPNPWSLAAPAADACCGQVAAAARGLLPSSAMIGRATVRGLLAASAMVGRADHCEWVCTGKDALCGIPLLALLGRVCLYTARRAGLVFLTPANYAALFPGLDVVHVAQPQKLHTLLGFVQQHVVSRIEVWLKAGGVREAWAAAGFDAQALLDKVAACERSSSLSCSQEVMLARLTALQALGVALNSLAHQYCCNNPSCSNLGGPQEVRLVNGRSCKCAGCKVAHYCCRACQKQHWKVHKPVCQAIAAAAAKAGAV